MTRLLYQNVTNFCENLFVFVQCFSFPVKKQNKVLETGARSQDGPNLNGTPKTGKSVLFILPSE